MHNNPEKKWLLDPLGKVQKTYCIFVVISNLPFQGYWPYLHSKEFWVFVLENMYKMVKFLKLDYVYFGGISKV